MYTSVSINSFPSSPIRGYPHWSDGPFNHALYFYLLKILIAWPINTNIYIFWLRKLVLRKN